MLATYSTIRIQLEISNICCNPSWPCLVQVWLFIFIRPFKKLVCAVTICGSTYSSRHCDSKIKVT